MSDVDDQMASIRLKTEHTGEMLRSMQLRAGKLPKPEMSREEQLERLLELRRENDDLEAKLIRKTFKVVS